jgi:CheY-like chemotaxis protein
LIASTPAGRVKKGSHVSKIVLCVDDSAVMQQVADITFRGTELTYVGARSVDEAIEKAKGQKPAIVLADAQMPGKTGYDLCLALKQDAKTADVPVVILCGNSTPYDGAKGTQVGADANLPKPWDTQTMLEKVLELVGKGASAKPGQAASSAAAAPAAAKPAPASAPSAAAMPPRSATIMGMPTIKMPAGTAAPAGAAAPAPGPSKTTVMAVPPISPSGNMVAPATGAKPDSGPQRVPAPSASALASGGGAGRASMVSGSPTKRSVLVERTLAKMAQRLSEATGLAEGSPELRALLALSAEVVERVVWEVVPELAEQIIRENLSELAARRS